MKIVFKKSKNVLVVSLSGEIDHHCAGKIAAETDRRYLSSKAKGLVIDFSGISFMDSSGLGLIIGRYKSVSAQGGKIAVAAPSDHVKKLLSLAGIKKIIKICGSVDAALKGM